MEQEVRGSRIDLWPDNLEFGPSPSEYNFPKDRHIRTLYLFFVSPNHGSKSLGKSTPNKR
jgi:hypothetical protein